jgi:predicted NUDIX family NTP pyrophosphohydrolase
VSITPDDSHPPELAANAKRRWPAILLTGLALGLAVVVFQTTEPDSEALAPEVAPSTTMGTVTRPLGELVPGFMGTLHAVEGSDGFRMLSWDEGQPLLRGARLSEGRPHELAYDAGGDLLGLVLQDNRSGDGTLMVGDQSGLTALGFEVSSFAWHQTEPGVMAAISLPFGSEEPELVTVSFEGPAGESATVRPVTTLQREDIVLAIDTWGILIRRHEAGLNRIVLLDEDGTQLWARAAHWAYASPSGDILLSFYSNETREFRAIRPTTPPTETGAWFELPTLGVTAVGLSPQNGVAVVTYQGSGAESELAIYDIDGNLLDSVDLRWRVWDVEWSRSGRFVIMPGVDDAGYTVLFYDTEEGRLTSVGFEEQILTAVVDR